MSKEGLMEIDSLKNKGKKAPDNSNLSPDSLEEYMTFYGKDWLNQAVLVVQDENDIRKLVLEYKKLHTDIREDIEKALTVCNSQPSKIRKWMDVLDQIVPIGKK